MTDFRLEVELADRTVNTFDMPALNVEECIRSFIARPGDGLTFVQTSTCNVFFWPWPQIRSLKVAMLS